MYVVLLCCTLLTSLVVCCFHGCTFALLAMVAAADTGTPLDAWGWMRMLRVGLLGFPQVMCFLRETFNIYYFNLAGQREIDNIQ